MGVRPNSPPQITSVSSKQPALFEVGKQRGRGLVDVAALVLKALVQCLVGRRAVRVPAPIEQLHVPHTAFDEPSREQAIVGEMLLPGPRAIKVVNVLRLLRNVDRVCRGHLHAERHFVLRDARHRLRIAKLCRRSAH